MSAMTVDHGDGCYIDLLALAGGDESHVFVDIILNMYRLWAYEAYLTFRMIEPTQAPTLRLPGRAKLVIEGADWELLASRENGVHRMIRFPPGKTQRHMSFVGVQVSDRVDAPLPEGRDGWGEQIRTLIINPEPALKNHRTGFVCNDVVGVMNGDLEKFWEEKS
jgi:protein subunit release factor B